MDPQVCSFFSTVSSPINPVFQCYDLVNVCQEEFFINEPVSDFLNNLNFTISFCDVNVPNVQSTCQSLGSFNNALQTYVSAAGLNTTELQNVYSLTRVPDCLALAMAAPSVAKIEAVYRDPPSKPPPAGTFRMTWIDWLVMAGILLGVILVITSLVKKSKPVGTFGFVVLAGTSIYGVDRWA